MDLRDLKSYQVLIERNSSFVNQIDLIFNLTYETMNSISRFYDNYTMHDMNHGLRVASYIEELAFGIDEDFDKKIEEFNDLELTLIILSAILHDIGMFIRPEDEMNIKANIIKYTDSLTYEGVLNVTGSEKEAVKEIIRITHAARVNEFINYDFGGQTISQILMINGSYSYAEDIVAICRAHGENYEYIKSLRTSTTKGSYTYNSQYIAVLLRIADYLDLDRQRTPILWYSMMGIQGFSREEWERHFIIQNEKKLRKYIDNKLQIYFDGKSSNAKIHRKYLKYIDDLQLELENANDLLNTFNTDKKYKFNISTKIADCVQTEGFKYSDLRLTLDYESITALLMGTNIYGDSRLGLRELIQNSIDACQLMKEIKGNNPNIPEPSIHIKFSKNNNYVIIKDTGTGMTLDVVKKHFLNVGKSYYKSREYLHKSRKYKPIGQYGIGFLACFLLSDNVMVKTRYYDSNEINQIGLEKNSEYVVTNTETFGYFFGTEIQLDYTKFFEVFESEDNLIAFVEKYFYSNIPIFVCNDDVNSSEKKIENSCTKVIDSIVKESTKGKYEQLDCSRYSSNFNGYMQVKSTTKTKSNSVFDIPYGKAYLFNSNNGKFELLEKTCNTLSEYYYLIKYSRISTDDYSQICRGKKNAEKKRNEIIALSKKQNLDIVLLVSTNESFEMMSIFSEESLKINGDTIEKIIQNSSLLYYPEMFDDSDYLENIFVNNHKFVFLQQCYLTGDIWRPYRFFDDTEKHEFFFYNKGIYISDFRRIKCLIPYPFDAIGCINYTGDKVKLDVSRNKIISGYYDLQQELSIILLKFLKERASENENLIALINAMIKSIETE